MAVIMQICFRRMEGVEKVMREIIRKYHSLWAFLMHTEPHRWCNCQHARRECGKSWVRALFRSNQRL